MMLVDLLVVTLLAMAIAVSQAMIGAAAPALAALAVLVGVIHVTRGRWQAWPAILLGLAIAASSAAGLSPPWVAIALSIATAGLAVWLWLKPVPRLPSPGGPYRLGLTRFVVERAPSPSDPPAGPNRRLLVYAWYPAAPQPSARPRPYHTALESRAFSSIWKVFKRPAYIRAHFRLAATHSYEDAAIAAGESLFPTVVFCHGGVETPTQNFALMEALASRGYVVLSVSHPGESAGVAWPDGSITPVNPPVVAAIQELAAIPEYPAFLLSDDYEERWRNLTVVAAKSSLLYVRTASAQWREDCLAVAAAFRSRTIEGVAASVAARADPDRTGYIGMSLGGSVAHGCCFADPHARAGINLDGMVWDFERLSASIPTPFLNLSGDPRIGLKAVSRMAGKPAGEKATTLSPATMLGNDFYYECSEQAGQRPDIVRLAVRGAAHMNFTDLSLAARRWTAKSMGLGPVDGRRMIALINDLCVAFCDRYVKGEPGAFPDALLGSFPELVRQDLSALRAWAQRANPTGAGS